LFDKAIPYDIIPFAVVRINPISNYKLNPPLFLDTNAKDKKLIIALLLIGE